MRERIGYMVLGAVLVMAGVFVGQQGANEAGAVGVGNGFGTGGNPLIFTQSADGETLHVWTTRRGERLPHGMDLNLAGTVHGQ